MALTATLSLDIKKFEDGLKKADVELQAFERATKTMNRDLKRLLEDFSGQKVSVEAARMADAVERVGGAAKLTESEQRRVNAAVTAAIDKYRALGQEAPAHLVALQSATARVTQTTSVLTSTVTRMAASFTLAGLAEKAISGAVAGLADFVTRGGAVSGMSRSFEALSGGVVQANTRIDAIRVNTRGLVGDFDAMAASNKAMLLGLNLGAAEMGELAKTATILGRAMGQDAAKSLDDLITALGRSSPMILDNLGLSVKVGEANEKYAASLGKTSAALTDAERKQAFMNAAMDAAREKVTTIGGLQLTAADRITQMWTSTKNLADATASWAVNLGPVNTGLEKLVGSMALWEALARGQTLSAGIADALKLYRQQIGETLPAVAKLSEHWRALPAAAKALTMSEADMAAAEKALTDTFTTGAAAADALQASLARFSAHAAIAEARDLVKVLGALGGPANVLPSKLDAMAAAFHEAAIAAAQLGRVDLSTQYEALAKTLRPVIQLQQRYNVTIGEFVTPSEDFSDAVRDQIEVLTQLDDTIYLGILPNLGKLAQAWVPLKAAMESALPAIEKSVKEMEALANAAARRETAAGLRDISSALGDLAQVTGDENGLGKVADIVASMSVGATAGNQFREALDKMRESGKATAAGLLQMAAGAAAAASALAKVTSEGTRAQRVIGGLATGASIGSAFGPWGTAIGAALGGIVGLFRSTKKAAVEVEAVITDWPKILTEGTDAAGHLSLALVASVNEMRRLGTATKDVTEYINGQASAALTGFNAVAAGVVRWKAVGEEVAKAQAAVDDLNTVPDRGRGIEWTKEYTEAQAALTAALTKQHEAVSGAAPALADLGVQALAAFNAALASGMSYTEALQQIQPGLQAIIKAHKDLGINIDDAALQALAMQSALLEKNPEILAGLGGIAQGMTALGNLGMLNADTFAAMQRTALDMYARLQGEVAAMGGSTRDALVPMQQYLQEAADQAERLGIPLDENTQRLIDQSKELGIWKDKAVDPMEQIRDVAIEIRDAVREMAKAFREVPTRITTDVTTRYHTEGTPPGGSGGGSGSGSGTTSTSDPRVAPSAFSNSGTRTTVVVPVHIDGRQVAMATVPYLPSATRAYGI